MNLAQFLEQVRGRLMVSCQALPDEPLHSPFIMARMAVAAQQGGAVAIRANSPLDIRAIRETVDLPIIGLYKDGESGVYITPTLRHAREVAEAGADVIALDATQRPRPNGEQLANMIKAAHAELGKLVLADVSTLEEGIAAAQMGADLVAPTLSGYTEYSPKLDGPDFALIRALAQNLSVPVIAEGRIRTPAEARAALDAGAVAVDHGTVCVGLVDPTM
jgi:N-acylglucosamine-6-phosphate 2-epimerase